MLAGIGFELLSSGRSILGIGGRYLQVLAAAAAASAAAGVQPSHGVSR